MRKGIFKKFDSDDWDGFAGAEGKEPLIANDDLMCIVIDDNGIVFMIGDGINNEEYSIDDLGLRKFLKNWYL